MSFVSFTFILFIAVVFAVYYAIPKRFQWMFLLAASMVFYAWSGFGYLAYILFTTLSAYLISRRIDRLLCEQKAYIKENKETLTKEAKKEYKARMKKRTFRWLILCLVLNFGLLAVIKYADFVIGNVNSLMKLFGVNDTLPFFRFALPMGISFYIFQTMGYMIDVYNGKYPAEKNPFRLALFVSFFPQVIQGPISRFDDLSRTLFEPHCVDWGNITFGVQRMMWGFFKKMVIADRIAPAVAAITKNPELYQGTYVWVGMFFYAVQLYADFTGGIDITIGAAQVMGISLKENFRRPFFSKSIEDYWRRWHITMCTWFKDYLFFPLNLCGPLQRLGSFCKKHFGSKVGKRVPVYVSTLVVWFTTGLWHGASWNFIVWGLLNGIIMLISQELEPLYAWFHRKTGLSGREWGYRAFSVFRTFWIVAFINSLDCYLDIGTAFRMMGSALTRWNIGILWNGALLDLGLSIHDYIAVLAAGLLVLAVSLRQRRGSVRKAIAAKPLPVRYAIFISLFMLIIIFGAYGIGYDSGQFIYNQF